jgi:hypothetical protein
MAADKKFAAAIPLENGNREVGVSSGPFTLCAGAKRPDDFGQEHG